MRTLPASPVFTYREALASGWSASALTCAVRRGDLTRLRRGIYAQASDTNPQLAALAAARAYPHSVVSHRSALLVHGLPLVGAVPPIPEITVAPRTAGNVVAVHLHRATLRDRDVTNINGTAVTSVARTLADVARHRSVPTAVAAIDAALHAQRVTADELHDVLRFCWNWPRMARAQRALRLSDGRSESPLESISRLVIGSLRLPVPALQTSLFDEHGRFAGRTDFYWDEFGVAGEADGHAKYDDRAVLVMEKQRQELFEDLGLVVARWGWADAARRPQLLRTRLERAFERGRRRDRSGFPRLWTL